MDFRLTSLILFIHISGALSLDLLSVTCEDEDVCALRENTVQLRCSYSKINIKTVFWFSWKQSSNWRKKDEPEDLTLDWDYSGRVKQRVTNDHSTLTISDLRERDSGEYQLMIIMKNGDKRLDSVAVNLTVTDLQVNPVTTDQRHQKVKLTCDSSCDLPSKLQNYYWKKNGQYLYSRDNIYRGTSFLPNGADGSYSCSLTPDNKIFSSPVCISKDRCWDVIYTSRRVCTLMGSTVDISCTYSHPSGHTVNKTFWHYGRPGDFKDLREKHEFAGRVEYVGNTLKIKELKISDSGEYRFRIISDTTKEGTFSGTPGVILTVTDTMVKSSPNIISEGQEVILSCSTKCTLSNKHTYIWYKNGRQVTDGFTKDNKLYLDSVSNEELQEYSCAVGEITQNQEQSTALRNTVIILSVILVLALIGVLWYRCRRKNSSQQHEERKNDVQSGSVTLNENAEAVYTVCTHDVKDQDVHYSTVSFKQSHIKDTSLAPTAVHSTSDDVHYASVKFS